MTVCADGSVYGYFKDLTMMEQEKFKFALDDGVPAELVECINKVKE